MALSIELVTEVAAFERLSADWNELVDAMEFPEIFYDGQGRRKPDAGFSCVLGNPPWAAALARTTPSIAK